MTDADRKIHIGIMNAGFEASDDRVERAERVLGVGSGDNGEGDILYSDFMDERSKCSTTVS